MNSIAPRLFIQAGYPVPVLSHSIHFNKNSSGNFSSYKQDKVGCGVAQVIPASTIKYSNLFTA